MRKTLLLGLFVLAAAATGRAYSATKSITVIAPNGGEMWCIGTQQTIKWTSANLPVGEKLKILIDREGDGTYDLLADNVTNNGSYLWEVEGPPTTKAKIRVSCQNIYDSSDYPFEIVECIYECGPTTFDMQCKVGTEPNGDPKYVTMPFELRLIIVGVPPDDPYYGTYLYKYIYTLTNKDSSASYPNISYGFMQMGNCEAPFILLKPKKSDGTEVSNWTVGTSPGDIFWLTGQAANYGVQPGKSLTFVLHTDQEHREGTVSVSGIFKKESGAKDDACAADVEFCVPGCPERPDEDDDQGCTHTFNLAQVYPVLEGFGGTLEGFPSMKCWAGTGGEYIKDDKLAIPGVFALATDSEDGKLDVNAFISGFEGETCCAYPVIQDCALFKISPRSDKCEIFGGYFVEQYGRDEIRTWWPLAYTMPGTLFKLVLQGVCKDEYGHPSKSYHETWCWKVVANPDTFFHLIDLFHTNALGECEVPSIVGEDTYKALKECAEELKSAWAAYLLNKKSSKLKYAVADAVMHCEGLIMHYTLWQDYLDAPEHMTYPFGVSPEWRYLPGNKATLDADEEYGSGGWIGIIDTDQNPAACKLIVDLEYIQKRVNGEIEDEEDPNGGY